MLILKHLLNISHFTISACLFQIFKFNKLNLKVNYKECKKKSVTGNFLIPIKVILLWSWIRYTNISNIYYRKHSHFYFHSTFWLIPFHLYSNLHTWNRQAELLFITLVLLPVVKKSINSKYEKMGYWLDLDGCGRVPSKISSWGPTT